MRTPRANGLHRPGRFGRLAAVVGVLLGTSLVTQVGTAGSAYALSSVTANPANAWVLSDLAASAGTSILTGTATATGTTAATAAATVTAGAVSTSAGMSAAVTAGVTAAGVGALVGFGQLPGMSFGFGADSPSLPSVVAGVPSEGPAGSPTAGNLTTVFTGSCASPTQYPSGSATPAPYTAYSATQGAASGGFRFLWTGGSGCGIIGQSGQSGGSLTFTLTLPAGQQLTTRKYWPLAPLYQNSVLRDGTSVMPTYGAPANATGACVAFTSTGGSKAATPQPSTAGLAEAFWVEPTGTAACPGAPAAWWSRSAVPYGGGEVTNTNPLRWLESTGNCKFPDGTVVAVTTSSSTFTRATGATGTQTSPAVPEVVCPAGSVLTDAAVTVKTEGSSTAVPVGGYTAPAALVTGLTGPYADCLTTVCSLHVVRLVPELDCSSRAPAAGHPCRDWSQSTDLATNWECRYGEYVLEMAACGSLERAYGVNPVIQPNTGTGAAPAPVGTDPMEDPSAAQTPGLAESGCIPSGWNVLNPFAYMKGVACALKWAFVPPAGSFEAAQATMAGGWSGNGIGEWGSALGDTVGSVGGLGDSAGTGCTGPGFVIPLAGNEYQFRPLDACDQPMQGVAVVIKLFGTVIVLLAGVRLCARPVMTAFGMGRAV